MTTIYSTVEQNWIKVKSKKELVQGMVLRIPWPDGALDNKIGFKELKINRISTSGNPIIETPSGGELEVDNLKEIYWKKGTKPSDQEAEPVLFAARKQGW